MEVSLNCPGCHKDELVENRENIRYSEAGFPNVTLRDIQVERCPECGNYLVNIPQMVQLHSLLTALATNKPGGRLKLTLKYTHLGWLVDEDGENPSPPGTSPA